MSNETKALAIVPKDIGEIQTFADILSKSTLLPAALRGKTPDIVVSILAGQELGLAPMAAIRGVHVVQGKPLLSADTMVGLCMSSGLCEYFSVVEETATHVTYETKRKGSPYPQRFTWSDEDTKAAGLNTKDNWRLHKRQMRRARCRAVLARDVFPDVLAGIHDPDEIQVEARPYTPPTDAIDAEIVDTSAMDGALADIEAAPDIAALKSLAKSIKDLGLTGDAKKRVTDAYQARKLALETVPAVTNGVNHEAAQS